MRGQKLRFAVAVVLGTLCACLVGWADHFAGAQPVPVGGAQPKGKDKDKDKGKDKDDRPARDFDLAIGLPYDRDAKNQLKAARDYLERKDIPWNTVAPLLQQILDAKSDSFFDVEYQAGGRTEINRISVKTEANRIIAAFPQAGLEFYQQLYGQTAVAALEEAVKNNYDLTMLADLSQRYFHTRAGAEATVLLASIYLDRGNYLEAAYTFERLLARPNADEFLTPRVQFKAALALKRSGDPRHAKPYQAVTTKLFAETTRNGLLIGRKTFTTDQVKAELDRAVAAVKATATVGEWAMRYGNVARNGTVQGGPPFLVPLFEPAPMLATRREEDQSASTWIAEELGRLFDRDGRNAKTPPLPGFFPVTTPDLVMFRTYDGVYAVATRDHVHRGELIPAGKVRWASRTMFGLHQLMTPGNTNYADPKVKDDVTVWTSGYGRTGVSSIIYENPLIGTLAHDGQYLYFLDDVAVPPPPVYSGPEFGMPAQQYRHNGELADAIRAGELVAVDIANGNRAWTLGRVDARYTKAPLLPRLTEEEADKTTSAFQLCLDAVFLGPPLPLNGRLYVLIEQAGVIRLLCLDPNNLVPVKDYTQKVPTLLWNQKIGRPNNTLPQDSIRRYQGAFLAAGEGIIVCPTNSGAIVGVDIMSRSLLWAHAYRKIQATDKPQPPKFDPTTGRPIPPEALRKDRWHAAAPIVSGGRVVVAAYDSQKLECIDLRTGKLLWSTPQESTDLYVGGVVNDKVIVVGQEDIRAYHLTGENPDTLEPKLAWGKVRIETPTGHGIAGKNVYFLPVRQANAGKDATPAAELWAINVDSGVIASKTAARARHDDRGKDLHRYGLGNLVFQDGLVVAQSAWEVACYPQLDVKRAEMDKRLKENPKDPVGLKDRGELLLDDGKLREAVADFKEAEKNNPPDALKQTIREKLYVAYTEIVRNDVQKNTFADSEQFLAEYESLCEVSLEGVTDPFERKAREDETVRRKRLYLYLLARGREGQGRLGEAFDHYLALATLGEGKALFEIPDEPSVRMRPDVWARGRIEGMIRKTTDAAARKSLEDRVNGEWKKVEERPDLNRLRDFVAVFGPYFPVGAQATLKLADALLATNNEEDAREAQTLLSQLRAAGDDPVVRAKATEALARLMTKNGQLEDAVGLYLQLGKEFPTVEITPGKTGADYVGDLLTDRRLLPYIEPARFPLPARVKAERRDPTADGQRGTQMFEVEPEGDLFPMFRRLRFVLDLNSSGTGQWTLRAFDRTTGTERFRFGNLQPPQNQINNFNPSLWMTGKFVQASGHLLLVQMGTWVYCLDLAERKEQWRRNLIGDNPGGAISSIQLGQDGEVRINYSDGSVMILGKPSALQPGYVALLTRDGLEVTEPVTRRPLWTRRNVSERTYIYGDPKYILLVEMSSDARPRPVSAKLLRAVDGMPIEGSPDAGGALAAARSYAIFGKTALLVEGGTDEPKVVRLYDIATGKDVWRKQYDAKAVPIRALGADWTGCIKGNGEVDILAVATGKPAGAFKLDESRLEEHLKGCNEAQLFADPERFYLVLDRDSRRANVFSYSIRTHRVNGPMYCFDRATGKRKWFFDEVFDNQQLVMEQFADLPVVIAAAQFNERQPNGVFMSKYKIVVVEKDRGRLLYNSDVQLTGYFNSMTVDLKNGTLDLHRHDLRIHISPDDGAGK